MHYKIFQQEKIDAIMYLSRLIDPHSEKSGIEERSLVFTIQMRTLTNIDHIQKAIFQKIHRSIYGKLSSSDEFNFSMFIAGDVEDSRSGWIPDHVLNKPIIPHFHGIIMFSERDWRMVNSNLSFWKHKIKSSILDIKEVKDDEVDEDGCIIKESIWIDRFKKDYHRDAKHHSPLGDYVQYSMKTHLQANRRGIYEYEPKVFPFDIYATSKEIDSANHLCKVMIGLQENFESEKRNRKKL
ncbi:hypothetical protein [Marivivens marinus]|uniref:hypothetical protein n=1 Tax=Marivivens marinus TaxID=3110173 RepID=UPI003B8465FC